LPLGPLTERETAPLRGATPTSEPLALRNWPLSLTARPLGAVARVTCSTRTSIAAEGFMGTPPRANPPFTPRSLRMLVPHLIVMPTMIPPASSLVLEPIMS